LRSTHPTKPAVRLALSSFSPCGRRWCEAPDEGFSPQLQSLRRHTPQPPPLRSGTFSHKGRREVSASLPRNEDCTLQTYLRVLAAHHARALQFVHALQSRGRRECRVSADTRGLVCNVHEKCAHEHTGTARTARHSLRDGFTAYTVLSLETNSFCLHRRRIEGLVETRLDFAKPPPA